MEINQLSDIVNNECLPKNQSNDVKKNVHDSLGANQPKDMSLDHINSSEQTERAKPAKSVGETEKEDKNDRETFKEKLGEAVDKLSRTAQIFNRALEFKVHEETNRTMVSVIDKENNKVIRQIPPEEALDVLAKIEDYIGLIFDKKG